jgi:DNA-binding MarR family transcriptional regulator
MGDGASQPADERPDRSHIMLGLLETVERDGGLSQRHLASELGIALGLVNAYLKKCIKKGFLKVHDAPARRYVYYLTPKGFAEKSRLTAEFLSSSFVFFRRAKADCLEVLAESRARGYTSVVLAGRSDLAEIAAICAIETGTKVVASVFPQGNGRTFIGYPAVASFDLIATEFDAVIVTDLENTDETVSQAVRRYGPKRVLVPRLLHGRMVRTEEAGR